MWTMLKYEIQRNRIAYSIFAGILAVLQIGYMIGININNEKLLASFILGLSFLGGITILFIMINGVSLYSRDLNQNTGYMVFMTPLSAYKIIGAKLLTTLIISSAFLAAFIGLGILDFNMFSNRFNVESLDVIIKIVSGRSDMSLANLGMIAIWRIILLYLSTFTFILFAYFAMSLSATLLQNKKGKKALAFFIFIGMFVVLTLIERLIMPTELLSADFLEMFKSEWPSTLLEIVCCIGAFWGTGYMMEKKISL